MDDRKCDTLDCINLRHAIDRTGFCRPCKIIRGMIKPARFNSHSAQDRAADKMDTREVKLPEEMLEKIFKKFLSLDQPAIIAGICDVWDKLEYKAKFIIVEHILDAQEETVDEDNVPN
jgi:hypothetical protein